jgi:hypothetical protein
MLFHFEVTFVTDVDARLVATDNEIIIKCGNNKCR